MKRLNSLTERHPSGKVEGENEEEFDEQQEELGELTYPPEMRSVQLTRPFTNRARLQTKRIFMMVLQLRF